MLTQLLLMFLVVKWTLRHGASERQLLGWDSRQGSRCLFQMELSMLEIERISLECTAGSQLEKRYLHR